MSRRERKILHLDMDAFYASVEQHDFPELAGRPVIVGGSTVRGVVSAASYEARRYGVHSAMPMARAVRLCPAGALRPVRMARYRQVSAEVFGIFARYTDLIEPLSIDEAFLDVTGCERLFGAAAEIAATIRKEVRRETGLTVSAGVAPNKFLAKLASDQSKPDGLLEIRPEEIEAFLLPLPVARLWGVGKVTARRLEGLGIKTVADVRHHSRQRLARWLGTAGEQIYCLSHGQDDRPVVVDAPIKSIGHEETYGRDIHGRQVVERELLDLAERVARRLRRHGRQGRCLTLKVRYGDFDTVTRSATSPQGIVHALDIYRRAAELLAKTEAVSRPVRLLGLSLSRLEAADGGQQGLFDGDGKKRIAALDQAMDRLRDRFGEEGIRRAALLTGGLSGKKKRGDPGDGT